MRYLGQQLAQLTGAISRPLAALVFRPPAGGSVNPGRVQQPAAEPVGRGGAGVTGLVGGLLTTFVAKLTVALGPIAVLAATLGSATSGFGIFLGSMKLLGGVLGSLLLPGFLVLSAFVYAVSGYIADKLLPVLGEWYQAVVDYAIQGAELFGEAVQVLEAAVVYGARKVREFADALDEWARKNDVRKEDVKTGVAVSPGLAVLQWLLRNLGLAKSPDFTAVIGKAVGLTGAAGESTEFGKILDDIRRRDERVRRPPPALGALVGGVGVVPRQGLADRFMEGLRMTRAEFAFQNRPAASFTTGADLYRQAQLAAVSVSPFEQKMLTFTDQVIKILGEVKIGLPQPALR